MEETVKKVEEAASYDLICEIVTKVEAEKYTMTWEEALTYLNLNPNNKISNNHTGSSTYLTMDGDNIITVKNGRIISYRERPFINNYEWLKWKAW